MGQIKEPLKGPKITWDLKEVDRFFKVMSFEDVVKRIAGKEFNISYVRSKLKEFIDNPECKKYIKNVVMEE